ncbi:MAG: hypothetical protein ITG02_09570 [Patulibacter sp.]|nr:hypothetical protein [Patulibacter sp.]
MLPARSAEVPDRLIYGLTASVGNNWSGPPNTLTFGERTETGWRARTAVRSTDQGNTPLEVATHEPGSSWLSPDGRDLVFGTSRPLGSGQGLASGVVHQIYRATDAEVAPTWLSQPTGGLTPAAGIRLTSLSASDDARTLIFDSTARLTPDAPPSGRQVYARHNGALQLVSRLPDGSPAANPELNANSINEAAPPSRAKRNELAGKGRFVLFNTGVRPAPLYVRDLEQNVTRELAGPEAGGPHSAYDLSGAAGSPGVATIPNGGVFGARDTARAYFRGATGSGPTSVAQIYEANLETGAVTARPAITGAPLQLTPDGQRMLFLNAASGGARELRFWDAAQPNASVLVGAISGGNTANSGLIRVSEPSADGRTWVFTAAGSLDPDRPNATTNALQLYRWTVGEAAPSCLSCAPVDGVARSTGARLSVQEGGWSETLATPTTAVKAEIDVLLLAQPGHGASDDGRWILFDSPDRLVPEDVNDVRDVYLWDRDAPAGSQLQMVTSGQGNTPSWALDLSPDGVNAFFSTREALVPSDGDGAYDVYTARVGTGFPDAPDESCTAETCRPPVILPPPAVPVASNVLTAPSVGAKQPVQEGTPKLRVRSVRTSSKRLTVRVDTPEPGRIEVSGKRVRTTKRTAKRATTYTLRVPLSARAQRSVARGSRLKVKLRVQFTPKDAKKSVRVSSSVSVKKKGR